MREEELSIVVMDRSKVQVEYTDPAGIFESIRTSLESALPLTNLHWNSSSRPLRSIPSLPVDLVPDAKTSSHKTEDDTQRLTDKGERGSSSQDGGPKKERRHQIPGLRQTPYLKLYLLQCDDIDTYRASLRQPLRDWVNSQAPVSSTGAPIPKSKQENHDAFEWLILHLTNDGTNSSRPTSTRAESEGSKKSGASRWTSRGSKSVVDKIRSDFNGGAKHGVDRVVQVHLPSASQQPHQLESKVHDASDIWDDLLNRMKSSILSSFSLRVQQYEEDIREKDLQRSLPGWNFNTFFVLKEGLARGFESVNLIEDALSGYQQLAAGLSAIVGEQLVGEQSGQQSTRFEACTSELRQAYEHALQMTKQQPPEAEAHMRDVADLGSYILDTDRKPFRVLILENNISIFDFQCYLFARQVSLLLRLANANDTSLKRRAVSQVASRSDADLANKPVSSNKENLLTLTNVAQLALDFIPSSAYSIRRDFDGLLEAESSPQGKWASQLRNDIVDNIIASWMFSACRSVLEVVSTQSLSTQLDAPLRQLRRSTNLQATSINSPLGDGSATAFPRRASSLSFRSPSASPIQSHQFSASTTSLDTLRRAPQSPHMPGLANLAGLCGDLVLLSRRILSNTILRLKGWQVGFAEALLKIGTGDSDMRQVELDDDTESSSTATLPSARRKKPAEAGITNRTISSALQSKEAFFALFEDLTAATLAHCVVADRGKMAEAMTTDLAVLCFILGDFSIAASYFKQLTSFYSDKQWLALGSTMLSMWAACLKEIGNTREYITVSLRAIASTSNISPSSLSRPASIAELVEASRTTNELISIPADPYFRLLEGNQNIQHLGGQGGFGLLLQFHSLFREDLEGDNISVHLLAVNEGQQCELELTCASMCNVKRGANGVQLISTIMRPGVYVVKKTVIRAGNMVFTHEDSPPRGALDLPGATQGSGIDSMKDHSKKRIVVWSNPQNLSLDVSPSTNIDLSTSKVVLVKITNVLQSISAGTLILRPASAGLRLHTSKAEAISGEIDTATTPQPGSINIGKIASEADARINIPFNLDFEMSHVIIKAEFKYTTDNGDFTFASDFTIPTSLSITVNVQDTFKHDALFSRFTVASASQMPVHVFKTSIQDSDSFEACAAPTKKAGVTVYAGQAYSLIGKMSSKPQAQRSGLTKPESRRLFLAIEYLCLDEAILCMFEASLSDALKAAKLSMYSSVLCQHFRSRSSRVLTAHQIEKFSLVQECNLGGYDHYVWNQVVALLPPAEARTIEQCLQKWHNQSCRSFPIAEIENMSPKRSLTVPVDIPYMAVVHTAQLKIYKGTLEKASPSLMMALGQVLQAKLTIEHTRKWGESSEENEPLGFWYDLEANLHDWLIGGQRSARFHAKEGDIRSFDVLLLPQRTGHLLLPSISIHTDVPRPQSSDGNEVASAADNSTRISCETDYLNQAESVMVVPDLSSTTVMLDPNLSTPELGGARYIESQSRADVGQGVKG